ncbi:Uncharacterised protein [Corynebacterium renale]|nr:Uncharacterised protein [Corynebacterium renale]STC97951.1 Uncharacterised protein [Corynebacterium renale]
MVEGSGHNAMQRSAAHLRHRELTQELYDIGDEVASYIENIAEAIADWDGELTVDCLSELDEIIEDARVDARHVLGELIGLRTALTTGLKAGSLSARTHTGQPKYEKPVAVTATSLETDFPLTATPVVVAELAGALDARTEAVGNYLARLVDWLLERTDIVANDLEALSYPHLLNRVQALVHAAAGGWLTTVVDTHPAYARARRGHNPPEFLAERARIDAVVAKVVAKRKQAAGGIVAG